MDIAQKHRAAIWLLFLSICTLSVSAIYYEYIILENFEYEVIPLNEFEELNDE